MSLWNMELETAKYLSWQFFGKFGVSMNYLGRVHN